MSVPGVAVGLAWTPVGGEVMVVEASHTGGDGGLTLTGQLGSVMQESAKIALSWVRQHSFLVRILWHSCSISIYFIFYFFYSILSVYTYHHYKYYLCIITKIIFIIFTSLY